GSSYAAPAQLVGDFITAKASTELGSVIPSYRPGVTPTDLAACLPEYAITAIREALPAFGRQIKGFDREDAVLTGVETRTSSPIRIRRGEDFQSLNTPGLYPAGEGAGFAGGILSAAVDGIRVAEAVARDLLRDSARTASGIRPAPLEGAGRRVSVLGRELRRAGRLALGQLGLERAEADQRPALLVPQLELG